MHGFSLEADQIFIYFLLFLFPVLIIILSQILKLEHINWYNGYRRRGYTGLSMEIHQILHRHHLRLCTKTPLCLFHFVHHFPLLRLLRSLASPFPSSRLPRRSSPDLLELRATRALDPRRKERDRNVVVSEAE